LNPSPSATRPKPLHVFLVHAGFVTALLGLLPATTAVAPLLLQQEGNLLFGSFGAGRSLRFDFTAPDKRADQGDTVMAGYRGRGGSYRFRVVFNSHRLAWWPQATLLGLLVATPMARRRRAIVLPAGVLLMNAFTMLHVAVLAAVLFAGEPGASGGWARVYEVARVSFTSPIPSYSAVLAFWALLARPAGVLDIEATFAMARRWRG
jgi:hypothetical protein